MNTACKIANMIFNNAVIGKLRANLKALSPQIKELIFTSRSKVELIKANSLAIERDFKKAREEMKTSEEHLDSIKRDLQTLYTLRANEYLKPRHDQRTKEINENENRLNEREREAAVGVANARFREEELFESFKASNDLLYQKSLNYANRFIALGVGIGFVMMTFRGYKWIIGEVVRDRGTSSGHGEVGVVNEGMVGTTVFDLSKVENELASLNDVLKYLSRSQETRFEEVLKAVADQRCDHTLLTSNSIHNAENDVITIPVYAMGVVGGIVGATVAMAFLRY